MIGHHTRLRLQGLALFLALAVPAGLAAQDEDPRPLDPRIPSLQRALEDVFSGDSALATVAFVERFWRLPGNSGFNSSLTHVVGVLERAGFVSEDRARGGQRLVYRIERRPMSHPTWEPEVATLTLGGQNAPLLTFARNRNMLAINSWSTPPGGVEAEVVAVGAGRAEDFQGKDVRGKIVYGETGVGRLYREAVVNRGALGVMAYSMPAYTKPDSNSTSIQFGSIPLDSVHTGWGILLSYAAKERLRQALAAGPVTARVVTRTRIYPAEEQTLVAEIRGSEARDERFVLSAHLQEPGANDNASGVAVLAELARSLAGLMRAGSYDPVRTLTFIWGDEIRATERFLRENADRAAKVRWGLSLDMVGENTALTGGTFLIEKMPDPSAVWTRGEDRHTEWGGQALTLEQMLPHYLNDFALRRCLEVAGESKWEVRTNPYEGGSDHTPFIAAKKPGLLFWHFTDQFYHTGNDRLDKVSPATLRNVGLCAGTVAGTLAAADSATASLVIAETERAALDRLAREFELSRRAVAGGGSLEDEIRILTAWTDWYVNAVRAARDLEVGGPGPGTVAAINQAAAAISAAGRNYIARLR